MNSRPSLWQEQLKEIHPSQREAAFESLESNLIESAGIPPESKELLLARLAVGNYVVRGAQGVEMQGRPIDIHEAAQFKGIELPPAKVRSVDAALAATLPRVIRIWGKPRAANESTMPTEGLRIYLNHPDLGHTYLDAEEEERLMRISAQGRALGEISNPSVSQQEVMQAAQEARNKLVMHNLKLAVHVAKRYKNNSSHDFEDLIQVANIGLIKAAQNAKPGMSARFTTYAVECIKNELIRNFAQGKSGVRIKSQHYETIKFASYEQTLAEKFGRRPTIQELIENDINEDLSPERIEQLRLNAALLNQCQMPEAWKEEHPPEEIDPDHLPNNVPALTRRPIPVDELFEQVHGEMLAEQLEWVLGSLSEREAGIIRMRFGFNDNELSMKLSDIARVYGVSSERIRQIERKTMQKLRHPSRSDPLKQFVN